MRENANRPPGSLQGGQLSQMSERVLGEEFKLEAEQIVGWASSQQQKTRAAQARALARQGMPAYTDWETYELEAEPRKRGVEWGRKKDPGKIRLLENDDDRLKVEGGGQKRKGKKKQKKKRECCGGATGSAGQAKKKAKAAGKKKKTKKKPSQRSRKKSRRG